MNLRLTTIMGFILAATAARLLFAGMPNASPITAIALFSGAYLADRKMALLVPVLAMLLSDLLLGLHNTMIFVYLAFMSIALIGMGLSRYLCGQVVIVASLVSSVVFFLVTNLGVWLVTGWYPHTLDGLIACYVAGIPFFQHTLLGDLLFTALLFGGFMFLEQRVPGLSASKPVA